MSRNLGGKERGEKQRARRRRGTENLKDEQRPRRRRKRGKTES